MGKSYLFEAGNFGFRPVTESDLDYFLETDTDADTMSFFLVESEQYNKFK